MAWGGYNGDSSSGTVYFGPFVPTRRFWKPQKGGAPLGSAPRTWSEAPKSGKCGPGMVLGSTHGRRITVSSDMNSFMTSSVAVDV